MASNEEESPSEVYETQSLEAIKSDDFEKALVYAVLSGVAAVREAADDIALMLSDFEGDDEEEE